MLVANLIADVLDALPENQDNNFIAERRALRKVRELCNEFPIYNIDASI